MIQINASRHSSLVPLPSRAMRMEVSQPTADYIVGVNLWSVEHRWMGTPMHVKYAIVWLEFRAAKIFLFDGPVIEDTCVEVVRGGPPTDDCDDHKTRSSGENDFFGDVVRSLQVAGQWFILGNRSGCFGLLAYICRCKLESRVVGTEMIEVSENMAAISHVRDHFAKYGNRADC